MAEEPVKAMFFIQGEGHGHMTQAMSLHKFLASLGIEVTTIGIALPSYRKIPPYVLESFGDKVFSFRSFEMIYDESRRVNRWKTTCKLFLNIGTFIKSASRIRKRVREEKPKIIVNFFESLSSLALLDSPHPFRKVSISHQNLFLFFQEYWASGHLFDRFMTTLLTRVSTHGSDRLIGLSLYPIEHPSDKVAISPPILREETYRMEATDEGGALVYVLNSGYIPQVIRLAELNPGCTFTCFTNHPYPEKLRQHSDNLFFHQLDGQQFMEYMRKSHYVITTAGFETVSEALFLGKKLVVVPIEGHYEQLCNGRDVQNHGLGVMRRDFNFKLDELDWPEPGANGEMTVPEWFARKEDVLGTLFKQLKG